MPLIILVGEKLFGMLAFADHLHAQKPREQGYQNQFHRGPHQHYGCTQRAGCNYINIHIQMYNIHKIMYYITLLDYYRIG